MDKNVHNRSSQLAENTHIPELQIIAEVIQHLPYYALILDSGRKILYSNDQLLKDHFQKDTTDFFNKKTGDVFQCENALEKGCGNSEFCKFCGIHKILLESSRTKKLISRKCNLLTKKGSVIASYEFMVRCSPLPSINENYYLLTMTDISHQSRRKMLERIFYHDVFNSLGSLQGLAGILRNLNNQPALTEYLDFFSRVTEQVIDIVVSQRDLSEAENRTLNIRPKKVESLELLKTTMESARVYSGFKNVRLGISEQSMNFTLTTDPILLSRVLTNMFKNALEASASEIHFGTFQNNETATFYIHSNTYILPEHQVYIFKRIFSTKDENRGLGTYSMRLIGENYLQGKVYFTTDHADGTTFFIDLPLTLKIIS